MLSLNHFLPTFLVLELRSMRHAQFGLLKYVYSETVQNVLDDVK